MLKGRIGNLIVVVALLAIVGGTWLGIRNIMNPQGISEEEARALMPIIERVIEQRNDSVLTGRTTIDEEALRGLSQGAIDIEGKAYGLIATQRTNDWEPNFGPEGIQTKVEFQSFLQDRSMLIIRVLETTRVDYIFEDSAGESNVGWQVDRTFNFRRVGDSWELRSHAWITVDNIPPLSEPAAIRQMLADTPGWDPLLALHVLDSNGVPAVEDEAPAAS